MIVFKKSLIIFFLKLIRKEACVLLIFDDISLYKKKSCSFSMINKFDKDVKFIYTNINKVLIINSFFSFV